MKLKSHLLTGIVLGGFVAMPALAQTSPAPALPPETVGKEIIVTGIRDSLQASAAL
jgi:hypothetical protein